MEKLRFHKKSDMIARMGSFRYWLWRTVDNFTWWVWKTYKFHIGTDTIEKFCFKKSGSADTWDDGYILVGENLYQMMRIAAREYYR